MANPVFQGIRARDCNFAIVGADVVDLCRLGLKLLATLSEVLACVFRSPSGWRRF